MNKFKVSVIVPIYNAGPYLRKCLDSLSAQTLEELEIILVLDCPTDGSDKVAAEYAKCDSRFRILRNPKNLHIGNSRNEGLKVAKGEYVAFCDHDDYVAPTMYATLYEFAVSKQLDMVCSPAVVVRNSEKRQMENYPPSSPELLPFSIFKGAVGASSYEDELKYFSSSGAIWCKIFKRSIIEKYGLCFVDTRKVTAEDLMFLIEYSYHCTRAGTVNESLYYHVLDIGNTGATLSYHDSKKIINYLRYLYDFLSINSLFSNSDIRKRFINSVRIQSLIALNKEFSCHNSIINLWNIIREFRKESFVREAFNDSSFCVFKHPTAKRKLLFKILKFIICC